MDIELFDDKVSLFIKEEAMRRTSRKRQIMEILKIPVSNEKDTFQIPRWV